MTRPGEPKIEIVPGGKDYARGTRLILVDGVEWGHWEMKQHGGAGNSFRLNDSNGVVEIAVKSSLKYDRVFMQEITVYGDKMARRRTKTGEPPLPPVADRLMEVTRDAINAGRLRAPDVLKAETAAALKKREEQRRAAEVAEGNRLEAKAREVLENLQAYIGVPANLPAPQADVNIVVAALRWAMTQ